MLKSYKYRLYPNKEQEAFLAVAFGNFRFVYNELLSQSMRGFYAMKQKSMCFCGMPNHECVESPRCVNAQCINQKEYDHV